MVDHSTYEQSLATLLAWQPKALDTKIGNPGCSTTLTPRRVNFVPPPSAPTPPQRDELYDPQLDDEDAAWVAERRTKADDHSPTSLSQDEEGSSGDTTCTKGNHGTSEAGAQHGSSIVGGRRKRSRSPSPGRKNGAESGAAGGNALTGNAALSEDVNPQDAEAVSCPNCFSELSVCAFRQSSGGSDSWVAARARVRALGKEEIRRHQSENDAVKPFAFHAARSSEVPCACANCGEPCGFYNASLRGAGGRPYRLIRVLGESACFEEDD
ncbi:unnamed protein product [Amoebophrya sp. A25]|nr:unnamed protein product [Amoebophrya sp. A25]|eukprot:GSA25T00000777001.1